MRRSRFLPAALVCFAVAPLAASQIACVATTDDGGDTSEDAFSGSDTQNLGTISYGQEKDVSYTSSPRYRAFTFQGKAGDQVDLTVSSVDSAPAAWVLTENFGYIAKGDGNSGTQHTTHVGTTLKKDGAYLVLFRASQQSASLHVALKNDLPLPPTDGDPFDPNYCTGSNISRSDFLARFAPGETEAVLGDVQLRVRQRVCQDQTGCQDWTDGAWAPFYTFSYNGARYVSGSRTNLTAPAKGTAHVTVGSSTVAINVTLDEASTFALGDSTNTSDPPSFDFRAPTLDGKSVQVGNWFQSAGNYQSFYQKKITSTCMQALSSGRIYDAQVSGLYTEYSVSIAGKYAAKAPNPPPDTPKGDVYDPAWCNGSAMTRSEFLSHFAPAATHAELGKVTLDGRERVCQDQTGCQAWHDSTKLPFYAFSYNGARYVAGGLTDIAVPSTGPIDLNVGSSTVAINLGLDGTTFALGDSTNTSDPPSFDFRAPTLDGKSVQVGNWFQSAGNYQSFYQKKITNSCLQALSGGRVYDQQVSGKYVEYAASLHATY